MKTILGLDVGVSSVGLSVIIENDDNKKEIKELAVRIVPEDPNFHGKFYSGNTASRNLDRTVKRGIRRSNQRFKIRRDKLYKVLKENNMFPSEEDFNLNSLELYALRAKAVSEKITLQEFGRILILLNQRRGFLSNRKSQTEEENSTDYKKRISDLESELNGKTIGQQLYKELKEDNNINTVLLRERTYLRATYIEEFDRIWDCQKEFYSDVLTGGLNEEDNKGTLYNNIRNRIIYYQRPLKSQKGLISNCIFEKHHKAITKTSPYFEQFRIWQKLNDLSWKNTNGELFYASQEQKEKLYNELFFNVEQKSKYKLTISKIKSILGYSTREKIYLNFTELDGSRTYAIIKAALIKAEIENPEKYLFFNLDIADEKGGLLELWHITYSLPTEIEVINTLVKRFSFRKEQATIIAKEVGYGSDYGSLSTRAIRKLLPHLQNGLGYSSACDAVGYDHSGYKTTIELQDSLDLLPKNSLRNPVVEQILNQVVNMVNLAIEKHGKFDEIRVELARELRNSAKTRKNITRQNSINKKENDTIRFILQNEYGFKVVNGRDVKRYILWKETNCQCIYCNNPISKTEFLNGQADIEHILPKSRSFSNSMSNFILAHRRCNSDKNQMTAYDFMQSKPIEIFNQYIERVNAFYDDGKGSLSKSKFDNLMCSGNDIPSDFVERMKKDTQYISKEAVKMLKKICENTYTTTGQVTDFLREKWELKKVLEEITFDTYKAIGQIETKQFKDGQGNLKNYEAIKDWSKRDDHRHHAVDALICALTDQKIIFKLNNLNKLYQYEKDALSQEEIIEIEKVIEGKFNLKSFADLSDNWLDEPIVNLRNEARKHLENIFISIKKSSSKVLTKNINEAKNIKPQTTWTPRGRIHEDTVMSQVKRIADKKIKLNANFNQVNDIVNPEIKKIITEYLKQNDNNPKIAFDTKTLKKNPILYNNNELNEVAIYESVCTKRINIQQYFTDNKKTKSSKDGMIENIFKIDKKIGNTLKDRLKLYKGDYKKAFSNLNENPIWMNHEKGIQIKSVTVYDESKVEKLHNGFVKAGGNHHALIYKDENGKYNEKVVSFWEAIEIGLENIRHHEKPYPIINRNNNDTLGRFQFSMQINDLFVFDLKHSENPQEENEINFLDMKNRRILSRKLFRVQKMSKKGNGSFDINFRHHFETTINRCIPEITWINIQSNKHLERITKIRINHLGEIIKIGE
jgi:CRISPR-associated endonuclease Csn1